MRSARGILCPYSITKAIGCYQRVSPAVFGQLVQVCIIQRQRLISTVAENASRKDYKSLPSSDAAASNNVTRLAERTMKPRKMWELGEFDGYPMWPWFSDFMGGIRFKNYIANRVSGTVVVEDATHPATKGLPSTFVIGEEEWYTFDKDPRPNVHVLAHVDEASYQPPSDIKMGDHPVIWTNEKMKARNIYILMGHHPSLLKNNEYKILVHNAILWTAGLDQTNNVTKLF